LVQKLRRTLLEHEAVGSILRETHFSHFSLNCMCVAHRKLRQRNEDRQCRPPSGTSLCLGGLRAGACKRCGGWFGPNFSAPARVRSKDGPPAVTRACCLRAASQWRLAIVCIPSKVVSKVLRSSAVVRALPVPVDRLCLRLSSASGCAHRKNGDLRTCYALAASSYRHAT
jgi:hypothetical protein